MTEPSGLRNLPRPRESVTSFCFSETRRAGFRHETHISTEQPASQTDARISCPYGHQGRPARFEPASRERPRASCPLIQGEPTSVSKTKSDTYPRSSRLTSSKEFHRVLETGQRCGNRYFTVLFSPNQADSPRLGLAIARKATGNSVRRNRIKRLIREAFRRSSSRIFPVDVVVMAKPSVKEASVKDIRSSLDRIWQRINEQCATSSSE